MSIQQLSQQNAEIFSHQLESSSIVGIDTEFHAERRYTPLLLLIQLQIPGQDTWIIDPTRPGVLKQHTNNLIEKEWVVHGGRYDLILLLDLLGNLPANIWDTQIGCGLLELHYPSTYGRLIKNHLNICLPKHATLSNWTKRPLSETQIEYAAGDVIHLPSLWKKVEQDLKNQGRKDVVEFLCNAQRENAISPPPSDTLFRKNFAVPHLTKPQATIFQELYAWRNDLAKANNQPPRSIVNDNLMLAFSKRQPATLEGLRQDRRLSKKFVTKFGEIVIEIIERARKRPEWAHPKFISAHSEQSVQLHMLNSFLLLDGKAHGYSPRLVFPSELLEQLVLSKLIEKEDLWEKIGHIRARLVGDRLWEFLCGGSTIQFTQ